MKFTWKNIIELMDNLWGWNQAEIARQLEMNPSTISRLHSGTMPRLDRAYDEIYQKLFAPKGSADQTKLLNEMKQELEEMGLGEIIAGLDSSSYESFTIGLIKLANARSLKDDAPQDNSIAKLRIKRKKSVKKPVDSPPREPEPLYKSFASAVAGFPIEKFLDSDPAASLADYLIWDAVTFWGSINAAREQRAAADATTDTDQSIITFIDALKDYLGFLMANSVRPDAFPDDFHLIGGGSEVTDTANFYRENAKDLFNTANAAVKAELEQTDTAHAGEYSPPPALEEYRYKFKAT